MCVEPDQVDEGNGKSKSNDSHASLPEPGKPTEIPPESLIPPIHQSSLISEQPTIAKAEVFGDIELSSVTDPE